ncbi:hypothetical protein BDZ91DRAFT_759052 [Kalaharituber pfeilii]|nr:hypothetical protein BDZ91DRAFT_759052 [Kalaharituber pfeilii]
MKARRSVIGIVEPRSTSSKVVMPTAQEGKSGRAVAVATGQNERVEVFRGGGIVTARKERLCEMKTVKRGREGVKREREEGQRAAAEAAAAGGGGSAPNLDAPPHPHLRRFLEIHPWILAIDVPRHAMHVLKIVIFLDLSILRPLAEAPTRDPELSKLDQLAHWVSSAGPYKNTLTQNTERTWDLAATAQLTAK